MDLLVIPDGNRRWAKANNKDYDFGYSYMPITINKIINILMGENIRRLYFWCNSVGNLLNRPKEQVVSFLNNYLKILDYAENEEKIRIHLKGNLELFLENGYSEFYERFLKIQELTKNNKEFHLYYFINYSTIDDIELAIKKSNDLSKFAPFMDEPENIDIVLRTGGYKRLSGFCPVRSPHADFLFVEKFFPDIDQQIILDAIQLSKKRVLNFGK